MPFDEYHNDGGGGGGDDPRHRDMDEHAEGCVMSVLMSANLNGRCESCTALAVGIKLVGRWLAHSAHIEMRRGVEVGHDMETNVDGVYGTIEAELHEICSSIMDAMKSDLADIVKAQQEELKERRRGTKS